MSRRILVQSDTKFIITIPDDATITFGPWSPPPKEKGNSWDHESKRGTLRIYAGSKKDNILATFSGVTSFRDLTIGYAEEIAKEEGATIWRDDEKGYYRENKVQRSNEWVTPKLDTPGDEDDSPV